MSGGGGSTAGFWRTAYAEHGTAVYAFLCSRLRRREDAEDLLHETFVRAIRAGDALRDTGQGAVLPAVDRPPAAPQPPPATPRAAVLGAGRDVLRGAGRASRSAGQRPRMRRRRSASWLSTWPPSVAALPGSLRQAFELGAVQKLPYAEIAARTGWSLSLVKVNVYRARKRLIAGLARVVPELGRLS